MLARVTFKRQDFFTCQARKHKYFLIKQCLHNWEDVDSLRILHNLRQAITPDGRLMALGNWGASGGWSRVQVREVAMTDGHARVDDVLATLATKTMPFFKSFVDATAPTLLLTHPLTGSGPV